MRSPASPETEKSHCRYHILASLFIVAAVAAVYSNTLDSAFHFDDFKQITGNQVSITFGNLFFVITSLRRWVVSATFDHNYALWGANVMGYHIVNISIHILNSILAYFVIFYIVSAMRGLKGRAGRIALFSALLFALHPVQTQAVTYITQRQESMSALFCLSSLFFLVLAFRSGGRVKRMVLYAALPICYIFAFYSKEIAITLPALLFLFDLYFAHNFGQGGWLRRWPLHAVMGALLIFFALTSVSALGGLSAVTASGESSLKAQVSAKLSIVSALVLSARAAEIKAVDPEQLPTAGFGVEGLSPKYYFLTELNVLTYYMALLVVPIYQNIDYDFPVSYSLFSSPEVREGTRLIYRIPPPIVSLLIIIAIFAAAFFLFWRSGIAGAVKDEENTGDTGSRGERGRIASFFILWFFITLSPTSSFIPIIDVIFEHRLYQASLGFFVIAVLLIDWISTLVFRGSELKGVLQ